MFDRDDIREGATDIDGDESSHESVLSRVAPTRSAWSRFT